MAESAVKTVVREKPIIFSGESVRAIIEGKKVQTRRVVKPQPACFQDGKPVVYCGVPGRGEVKEILCPHGQVGDRLWVKETHAIREDVDPAIDLQKAKQYLVCRADREPGDNLSDDWHGYGRGWRSPIHMPRWASRLTLEIVEVRVERLAAISEADAYAEGVTIPVHLAFASNGNPHLRNEARTVFQGVWDNVNGKKHPWESNCWVWVITFRIAT